MKDQINPLILIDFDPKIADKRFSLLQQQVSDQLIDDFIKVVSVDDFRNENTSEKDLIERCSEVINEFQSDEFSKKSIEHNVVLGDKYVLITGSIYDPLFFGSFEELFSLFANNKIHVHFIFQNFPTHLGAQSQLNYNDVFQAFLLKLKIFSQKEFKAKTLSTQDVFWVINENNIQNIRVAYENIRFGIQQLVNILLFRPQVIYEKVKQRDGEMPLATFGIASLSYPVERIRSYLTFRAWNEYHNLALSKEKIQFQRNHAFKYKNSLLKSIGLGSEKDLLSQVKSEKEFTNFPFPEIEERFGALVNLIGTGVDKISDFTYKNHSSNLIAEITKALVAFEDSNPNQEVFEVLQRYRNVGAPRIEERLNERAKKIISDPALGAVFGLIIFNLLNGEEQNLSSYLVGPSPSENADIDDLKATILSKHFHEDYGELIESYAQEKDTLFTKKGELEKLSNAIVSCEEKIAKIEGKEGFNDKSVEYIELKAELNLNKLSVEELGLEIPDLEAKVEASIIKKMEFELKFAQPNFQKQHWDLKEKVLVEKIEQTQNNVISKDLEIETLVDTKNDQLKQRKKFVKLNLIIAAAIIIIVLGLSWYFIKLGLSLKYTLLPGALILLIFAIFGVWRYKKLTDKILATDSEIKDLIAEKKRLFLSWHDSIRNRIEQSYLWEQDKAIFQLIKNVSSKIRNIRDSFGAFISLVKSRSLDEEFSNEDFNLDEGNIISVVNNRQIKQLYQNKLTQVLSILNEIKEEEVMFSDNLGVVLDTHILDCIGSVFIDEIKTQKVDELFTGDNSTLKPQSAFEVYVDNLVQLSSPLITINKIEDTISSGILEGYLSADSENTIRNKFNFTEEIERLEEESSDISMFNLLANIKYKTLDPDLSKWYSFNEAYSDIKTLGIDTSVEINTSEIFRHHNHEVQIQKHLWKLVVCWLKDAFVYNTTDRKWHLGNRIGKVIGVSSFQALEYIAIIDSFEHHEVDLIISNCLDSFEAELDQNNEVIIQVKELVEKFPLALTPDQHKLLSAYVKKEFDLNLEIKIKDLDKVETSELDLIAKKIFEQGEQDLDPHEQRISERYNDQIEEMVWELEFLYKKRVVKLPDPVVLEKVKLKIAQKLLTIEIEDLSEDELEIYNSNKIEIDKVLAQLIGKVKKKPELNDDKKKQEVVSQFRNGAPEIVKDIALSSKTKNYLVGPKRYNSNPHVQIKSSVIGEKFNVDYVFKDHYAIDRNFQFSFNKGYANSLIEKYGLEQEMFEPYFYTSDIEHQEIQKQRAQKFQDGLFKNDGKSILVDDAAYINFYKEFAKPIADYILNTLQGVGKDTEVDRIRFAMSFIQDIPYGVPDFDNEDWYYQGVATPPEILLLGYGDCDSKAFLFASILSYLIPKENILLVHIPNHCLSAVSCDSISSGHSTSYNGKTYYFVETAGPGRIDIGEKELKHSITRVVTL